MEFLELLHLTVAHVADLYKYKSVGVVAEEHWVVLWYGTLTFREKYVPKFQYKKIKKLIVIVTARITPNYSF